MTVPPRAMQRDQALDCTKGILVLSMIVYHSLNYFRDDRGGPYMKYLRFVPPSFILITGFLVSYYYTTKFKGGDPRVRSRLLIRGLKLFAVFTILNLIVGMVISVNYNGRPAGLTASLNQIGTVYLLGGSRTAVFEVLLPISYLLIFSAALLDLLARRWLTYLLVAVLLILQFTFIWYGVSLPNFRFLTFGLIGLALGWIGLKRITQWASHVYVIALTYLLYLFLLTWWHETDWTQYLGACLTLLLIYAIAILVTKLGPLEGFLELLGTYSLVGYILQIILLQLLLRLAHRLDFDEGAGLVACLATVVGTFLLVKGLDLGRRRFAIVDKTYKAVFA